MWWKLPSEERQMHITHKRIYRQFQWVPEYWKFRPCQLILKSPSEASSSRQLSLFPALSILPSWNRHPFVKTQYKSAPCVYLTLCCDCLFLFPLPASLFVSWAHSSVCGTPQHSTGPGSGMINTYGPEDQAKIPAGGWHCCKLYLDNSSQRQTHTSHILINPQSGSTTSLTRLYTRQR